MTRAFVFLALLTLSACAGPMAAQEATPEAARGGGTVSAANPIAVEAGLRVLRQGGSAVDAAVAVQAVLGLVEPQSSGLAGGAFMVVYDAKTRTVTAYDGRETAPAAATPNLFQRDSGGAMPFGEAVASGRSTGAPGVVAMFAQAQGAHGRLAWSHLFDDAERLARDGFAVPQRMAEAGNRDARPDIKAYVGAVKVGDVLKNPAYADTVRRIAAEGPRGFYEGPVAAAIAARVAQAPTPGALTAADIAAYRAKEAPALCRPYRLYIVCAPPAPSGGVGVLMILGILEHTDIAEAGPTAGGWYDFAEASRLMYADRDRYVADPAFVDVPIEGLLDRNYLKARAALIGPMSQARQPGSPPGAAARAVDATAEVAGTSSFVVVDGQGNVVSVTTSVEGPFGSGRMAAGMVLNNQLTDFSFAPLDAAGAPVANAPAGGKRPRSSMAPVIVLDREGRFVMAVGSPGGMSIPAYNAKVLVGVLDWGLSLQEAIELPNVVARGTSTAAETTKFSPEVIAGLAARGIVLRANSAEGSGLHGVIVRGGGRLEGAADPRREGVALAP